MNAVTALHIAASLVAVAGGGAALLSRKGSRLHAAGGRAFAAAMLTLLAMGLAIAPLKAAPSYVLVVSTVVAFYLVATGWATIRHKQARAGRLEYWGLAIALACAAAHLCFCLLAAASADGRFQGMEVALILPNLAIALAGAAGDLNFILRGQLSARQRLARHVWRMCVPMFLATFAFFAGNFGQEIFIPEALRGSMLLGLPPLAVLAAMAWWLLKLRFPQALRRRRSPAPALVAAAEPR